jgi:hypothetical protein
LTNAEAGGILEPLNQEKALNFEILSDLADSSRGHSDGMKPDVLLSGGVSKGTE